MIRAGTSTRIPPLALAAAAGLHALVGIAVLDLRRPAPALDEASTVEIALVMPAASPERESAVEPEPAVAEPEPLPTPVAQTATPPPPEPEVVAFDPAVIPEPEPPPPLVLVAPKPPPPKPAPPKPATIPRPAPDVASTAAPPVSSPAPSSVASRHDPSYLDRLAAAIERERDYPAQSRRQGHQGRVVIHLVIAASGRLISAHVHTGSGQETLDRTALGMVQRARLPPLTPGFGADSATFTIPIVFAIR